MEVSDQLYTQAVLSPGRHYCTHIIGGWVDSRGTLDISEIRKSPASTGIRTPDLADRSLVTIQSTL